MGHYAAGYALVKQDKHAEALVEFRKYIKEKDETDEERYADALIRIADCYFMQRDQVAALEYYDRAIGVRAKAADYALYQKGIILGVRGRLGDKAAALEKLTADHAGSVYMDDALYETGQAYLTMGNNSKAQIFFRKVIEEYPKSSYVKKAELGEALVYYNDGKDDQAAAACKRVIERYPGTAEAKEALLQLKNISVARHQVDDYLRFVRNVPNAEVSAGAEDSLVYEAAEVLYTQGKCQDAIRDFDRYLDRFPKAVFLANANYYRSDCLYQSGQLEASLPGFDAVLRLPRNQFTEKSLLNAATIRYRLKQYEQAVARFEELERTAEVKENIASARIGQLRCYDRMGDCSRSVAAATKVLSADGLPKDLQNEAQLITARCQLTAGEFTTAKETFTILVKRTNSEITAESRYSLAFIEYKQMNYKEAQKLALEVQNQVPSYDYWVAKSFILLGDCYLAQKDTFQAKATYKSIYENYESSADDPDDLKSLARTKYDALLQAERSGAALELENRRREAAADSLEVNPIK
jgi:TolA-binding protein